MSEVEAFRPFAVESPRIPRTVRAKLEARRAELLLGLRDSTDWEHFQSLRGIIEGLEEAIIICKGFEEQN